MYSLRRFVLIKLPRFTLLQFTLALLTWLACGHTAVCAPLPTARLMNVTPRVQVTRAGNAAGLITAGTRTPVWSGDIVHTWRTGRTRIQYASGRDDVYLPPFHEFLIEGTETPRGTLLGRVLGAATAIFIRTQRKTEVQMAAGKAASRGTAYLIQQAADGSGTVTVVEGSVEFFNPQGTVTVNEGEQGLARVGEKPTKRVATDISGLVQWTADISDLPLEFETPLPPDPTALQPLRIERAAEVRANPDNAEARQRLGAVLHELGEYSLAVEEFEAAARLAPQSVPAYLGLGRAKLGNGDALGAIAAYQEAQKLAPDDVRPRKGEALAHTALGLAELREGDNPQAIKQLKAALERDPQLYQARSLLALAYLGENQMRPALQEARHAVAMKPGSAQTQGTLAMVLFFNGNTKEAARSARLAVEMNPLSPFALLTQGRVLLSQLKTDQARLVFLQAQALAPDLPIFYNELGAVYLRLEKLPKAAEAYQYAQRMQPNSAPTHTGLGVVLQRRGRFEEAEAEYQKAFGFDPDYAPAHGNYAYLLIELGRLDEAERHLQQAIAKQPEFGIGYVRLAEVSLYNQKLFTAQEYARRAVQLLPNSAIAHYQLGRVYLEQGRTVQAEQQFRQAVTLDPQFAEARYGLGFSRELAEKELSLTSFVSGGATLGSSATSLTLQNLQTPGAEERIQAAIQDPTVVRVASRSYGDTQLGALAGGQDTRNLDISHLETTGTRRGVRGIIVERQETDGVRENADRAFDRVGMVFGQKAKTNPSALFILGQFERSDRGFDTGLESVTNSKTLRSIKKVPLLLAGINFQSSERSRTRLLVQGGKPWEEDTNTSLNPDVSFQRRFDFRSLNVEARHDRQVGSKHRFSAGLFAGTRSREVEESNTPDPETKLFTNQFQIEARVRASGVYLRDEMRVNDRLTLIGELQAQRLAFSLSYKQLQPPSERVPLADENITVVLPKAVIAYQPNARSGFRFRARRLFSTPRDFQLLSPTDVFLELEDLPEAFIGFGPQNVFGRGRSFELEYDHTFRNASFLRMALFHQRLGPAQSTTADYRSVQQYGARTSYEGVINRDTTFFMRLHLNRAKDATSGQDVVQVPHFAGEIGLQYLNRDGYFLQPLVFYSGGRLSLDGNGAPIRLGGFGVYNVRVGKRWGLRSTLYVEVNNVFDRKYTTRFDELQPGRQLRFGVTQRL